MGSLGYAECHWCKKGGWNYYIPDGVNEPLCEKCLWSDWVIPQEDLPQKLEPEAEPEIAPPVKKRRPDTKTPDVPAASEKKDVPAASENRLSKYGDTARI